MTTTRESSTPDALTRRDLLKAGGLTLGALALGTPAAAQTPKAGGTLVSAQTTEATGLDPQLVPALSRSRRSPLMYSQLVRYDADMNPRPELAESWQISPDGHSWTFKLREGVKFHDGQEMTSADVKFTFDRLFESSPGKSDFIAVDKVEPAGKYGVKFITKEPFARRGSRSTAISTRRPSAPAPSCSWTGRSSSSSSSRKIPTTSRRASPTWTTWSCG